MEYSLKQLSYVSEKNVSKIDFEKGFNIVYGPSNVGKTYIISSIDYMYGSSHIPINESHGYKKIELIVVAEGKEILFSRIIGDNKISVISQLESVKSGEYATDFKNGEKYNESINSVWLKLIGIEEWIKIISSQAKKTKSLSWRSICHMFMLDEERIIKKASILLPDVKTAETASISGLLYLITGDNHSELMEEEDNTQKKLKRTIIEKFIEEEIREMEEEVHEIKKKSAVNNGSEFQEDIINKLEEIEILEKEISTSVLLKKQLFSSIAINEENLSIIKVQRNRYETLMNQYDSDVERLTFIIDGVVNLDTESICSFCSSKVILDNSDIEEYIEAAKEEYKEICNRKTELEEVIQELLKKEKVLLDESTELAFDYNKVKELVEMDLSPKMIELQEQLQEYRVHVEMRNTYKIAMNKLKQKRKKLTEIKCNDEKEEKYMVKDYLTRSILDEIDTRLFNILKSCNFPNLEHCYFDKKKMDLDINSKAKENFGKGYRAYLNTLLSLVFLEYLIDEGMYSPKVIIMDSPILSLKERDSSEEISNNMKVAVFKKLKKLSGKFQIIVLENEIPKLNYGNTKLHHFTKDEKNGRYGLLDNVRD